MIHRILSLAFFVIGASSTANAQIRPIAAERFGYQPLPAFLHGQGGDPPFSNNWFVQNNQDVVVLDPANATPAFGLADPATGFARHVGNNGASYRVVDPFIHPDVTELSNGAQAFGRDGATIWFSFSAVRYTGQTTTLQHFGGLRLFEQGCCEQLFIGSPWMSGGWGIDDEGANGAGPVTIPGSSNLTETRIVVRIDHLTGDERVRMWLNPATPHPITPADLDQMVHDFHWQEISFTAGGNEGALFDFDNLVIEKGDPSVLVTNYCGPAVPNTSGLSALISASGSNVVAQNDFTLHAENLPPNSFGFFLTSPLAGLVLNPGGSQGHLCLTGAIGRYVSLGQIKNSGSTGSFELLLDLSLTPTPNAFVSVIPGETRHFQTWFRDTQGGAPTSNFTDGCWTFWF